MHLAQPLTFLLVLLAARVKCAQLGERYRLRAPSVRAFTPDEFFATYELMVQYKYGNVSSCPVIWQYKGIPIAEGDDLFLMHSDMLMSSRRSQDLVSCNNDGALHLLRSTRLNGSFIDSLKSDIANDVDKTTVFNSIYEHLAGHLWYVSTGTSPTTCGDHKWFDQDEMFVFFDQSETVSLSVVAKILNGGPRILSLPLMGDVRYMLSVRAGTTCIYRVESDVQQLTNQTARPSDSPSPVPSGARTEIPQLPNASPNPSQTAGIVQWVVLPSKTPAPSTNPTETQFPMASPIQFNISDLETPSASPSLSETPSVSATLSASPTVSVSATPSPSSSVTPLTASRIPQPSLALTPGSGSPAPPGTVLVPSPTGVNVPWEEPKLDESADGLDTLVLPSDELSDVAYSPESEDAETFQSASSVGGSCFPASATVALEDGGTIAISDLRVGQHVAVGVGRFSRVMLFTHRDPHVWSWFVRIRVHDSTSVSATGGHFIYANRQLTPMRRVAVGDMVMLADGSEYAVVDVAWQRRRGLFNAHTESGDIVVDGVKASCYTEAINAISAHSLLAPVRAIHRYFPTRVLDHFGDRIGSLRHRLR